MVNIGFNECGNWHFYHDHDPEVKETWERNLTERLLKRTNKSKTHMSDVIEISGQNKKSNHEQILQNPTKCREGSKTNGTE